jgi:hypothetical protein
MALKVDPPEVGESLFEHLSLEGRDLAPVIYRFIFSRPVGFGEPVRLSKSRVYRATVFACINYHKPISRTLPFLEE